MLLRTLLAAALLLGAGVVDAATLTPIHAERFFVTPGEPAVLRWQVEGALEGPVEAIIRDYCDRPVAAVPAEVTPEGTLELSLQLPAGFYDIELPAVAQRFGVMSLAAYEGRRDPFFSIDAAMSWLVGSDRVREGLVKVLNRTGVAMSRERLNWGQISPAEGQWDWDSPLHYETLRRTYAEHGVEVLEMFHGTTRWAGHVGKYPEDLVGTMRAWGQIGRRWRPTWTAMEVWNEPDIFFGGNLPADQYVPLVKTFAYAFDRAEVDVPLVGGVFAHFLPPYLDNAARNGLLENVDVASFHTYGRAPGMEDLIGKYRSWLEAPGRAAVPLWVTECGRPWKRGPGRPPADQDAESALDITMKAVESRACGIARYFAFVYPFYEERDNNFGMMGRHATPLRSMAAYARLTSLLAHKRYLGDLQCDDETIQRARVFGDDRQTVAVVYTGRADARAKLKLDLPTKRVEGIDGRVLAVGEDGSLPVPDGLVHVWLDREVLGDRLGTDTTAMRLSSISRREPPRPKAPSPIVLRYQFDPEAVDAKSGGYYVEGELQGRMLLKVRVFNLSPKPRDLRLRGELKSWPPERGVVIVLLEAQAAHVPPEDAVDITWQVDLSEAFGAGDRIEASFEASEGAPEPLDVLHVDFLREKKDSNE